MDTEKKVQIGFIKRKLINPLLKFLKEGVTPPKLAWAVAWGAVISVFPVFGSTTILCAAIALIFRLNMAAIQIVNYFLYPLQFVLYIPLIRIGEWLLNAPKLKLSASQILNMLETNVREAINSLWLATLHAIAAWLLIGPLVAVILYLILKPIFKKVVIAFNATLS